MLRGFQLTTAIVMTICRVDLMRGLLLLAWCAVIAGPAHAAEIEFNRDVRPILSDICYTCHGPDEGQRVSEFRLDTKSGAVSDSGDGRSIVPHDSNASLLYQRITSDDPEIRMPPPDSGKVLSSDQIAMLGQWIDAGARWQEHWAFVPPTRPKPPATHANEWCRNGVDPFVLAKLQQNGLTPSPRAIRRKLIRRVTLDLTGLPATPEEVQAFVADRSPDAFGRVVDRLLNSPRYGERMAIDWLDAARYADTSGYQNDGPRQMWRWRDWVIDAFNQNMPFDRFTVEQLAGDLLPSATLNQRIATGFNRNHRGNAEGGIIPEEYQVEYVVDRVDTTATVWLGLTMGCARCHDHKYDAISQKDFYRVFAYFNNIPESGRAIKEGNSPPYLKAPTEQQKATLKELDDRAAVAARRIKELQPELEQQQLAWEDSFFVAADSDDWTITDGLTNRFRLDGDLRDAAHGSARSEDPPRSDASPVFRKVLRQGKQSNVAQFVGKQAAEIGDVADFGYFDKFTLSARIRPTRSTGTIISRMIPVDQGSGYYVHLNRGHLQVNLVKRWLDDSIRVQSQRQLRLGDWQHITVTYDGSRVASGIRVYVDGQPLALDVQLDGINQSFATEEPLRIGGGQSGFFGDIDDVQVYNRVLDEDEVRVIAIADSIADIVATDRGDRTFGQSRKLTRFFIERHSSDHIRNAFQSSVSSKRKRDQFYESIPTVMVMREKEDSATAFVLDRGRYDDRGEQVAPGVPDVFSPLPKGAPNNRLGFAKWIVSPDHPLTARVTVNRVWQKYFGTGLVKTSEDFGSQGDAPSHPLLLDWLAIEFMRSGWDIKALHRQIVTSATYQQDSGISPGLRELDPDNRLLARGPRIRLPAEAVRDQALAISGLLTEKIGGPSVRPYQPKGLWKEIASTTDYQQSQGEDLFRRSMYTYWKRTVAPPTMVTLDAASRESCIVKRSLTNTPLQALALMNEVTFVEASRALAEQLVKQIGSTDKVLIVQAFERATSRRPTDAELKVLVSGLSKYREAFRGNTQAAQQLVSAGQSPRDESLEPAELAAWTFLVSIILNLDEVISKE